MKPVFRFDDGVWPNVAAISFTVLGWPVGVALLGQASWLLNALGVLHAQAGRTAEALAMFDRARVLEPLAAHVHNNMGYALLSANRLKEAELTLRVARELDPNSLQILENLDLLAKARIEHDERNRQVPAGGTDSMQHADHLSGPQLVAVAPHVYELRTPGPQVIEAMAGQGLVRGSAGLLRQVLAGKWADARAPIGALAAAKFMPLP